MSKRQKIILVISLLLLLGIFARFGREWNYAIQIKLIEKKYDGLTMDGIPTARYTPNFSFDLQHFFGVDDAKTDVDGMNNPGNAEYSGKKIYFGENTPAGNKFRTFKMLWHGYRAIMSILRAYNKEGYDTLTKMINHYAPPADNNPNNTNYVASVAQEAGIGADDAASTWINSDKLRLVAKGIAKFEQGPKFFVTDVDTLLAYESLKIPAA